MDLRFEHHFYIGSQLGEYIPEICVEPALTDPAEYYVQGWEGFFKTIGTTTITEDVFVLEFQSLIPIFIFGATWNATHLKPCFKVEYSNIASYFDVFDISGFAVFILYLNNTSRQPSYLEVFSSCKSIVIIQVW